MRIQQIHIDDSDVRDRHVKAPPDPNRPTVESQRHRYECINGFINKKAREFRIRHPVGQKDYWEWLPAPVVDRWLNQGQIERS